MAWKNGGGITHEIMREPAATSGAQTSFTWRISIAQIAAAGPFSAFPGHTRVMALLSGHGVELEFADGRRTQLRQIGEWVTFDGAVATHCRLLGGPCIDLNLMVAKDHAVEAQVHSPLHLPRVQASAGAAALVVGLTAPLTIIDEMGARTLLAPWELAVLSQGSVRIESTHAVFVATLRS